MDSTTKRNDSKKRERKHWLRKVFGGEFLLNHVLVDSNRG